MVDNVNVTEGTGTVIAADDVGGAKHQRVKPTWGPDGTGNDVDTASGKAFPVQLRSATGLIPIGEPTDAKSTATDTTSASGISIWKQISASVQLMVFGAGTAAAAQRVTHASDDPAVVAIGSTNTKLDTLHADLATTLAGYVDGLETLNGPVTETAPATDTASSGLNGRLQRIAQRVTSLIALLPASIGGKTAAASLGVTLASDDPAVATLGATTGAAVITDANGTVQQYLRGLVKRWVDALGTGTAAAALRTTLATDVGLPAGTSLLGKVKTKFFAAAGAALTRPANTTAYTANDAISDSATIGSVTAKSITVSDVNDDTVTIERLRLATTDTGLQGKSVRAFLYSSDPTANSGVQGGDNAAFSNKLAGFIGTMSGTFRTFSDGAVAVLVPDEGSRIICAPGTGARTIWWQLQALDAFTPSANSTTITPTAEGFQGAA